MAIVDIAGRHVETGVTHTGGTALTWATAAAPWSAGLRLAVSRQGIPFRESFAITCGDPEFDDRFTIKTNDAPFARLWLNDEVRDRIAASAGYHFLLEHGRTRAWRFCDDSDEPPDLDDATLALAALSSRGDEMRDQWVRLANHIGGRLTSSPAAFRPHGAISIRVATGATAVSVDGFFGALAPRRPGRGLFTRVRCPRHTRTSEHYAVHDARGRRALRPRSPAAVRAISIEHRAFSSRYRLEGEHERASARFDRSVCDLITEAGPEIIVADTEHVTVFFLGFEIEPDRIRTGVQIARRLAVDADPIGLSGPYR